MKKIFMFLLLFSFLFLSCGKKDSTETDVKKDQQKTETKTDTKQETQSSVSQSDLGALPNDFPLKDEAFKKAKIQSKVNSSGSITVTFYANSLPDNIIDIVDKELTKAGMTKGKEEKYETLKHTDISWTKGDTKITLYIYTENGKTTDISVLYESAQK